MNTKSVYEYQSVPENENDVMTASLTIETAVTPRPVKMAQGAEHGGLDSLSEGIKSRKQNILFVNARTGFGNSAREMK